MAATPTPHPLCSTFAGAALLAACAVVAGALPFASPVGLVTAIIGGPALVLLVWLAARRGTLKGMVQ